MQRRGFVLIIVVALLGVMAFLALELARKSQDYRSLSLRGLHKVRATMTARAGMERAIAIQLFHGPDQSAIPFEHTMAPAHEDRNRNDVLDAGEDLDGNGVLNFFGELATEATPSFAIADPTLSPTTARSYMVDGKPLGATWVNDRDNPSLLASTRVKDSVIDVNAGVESGLGAEGGRMALELGHPYSATSCDHPFNSPLVRLLNAWGNFHKYRHMVRPGKSYDWTLPIFQARNMPIAQTNPGPDFDPFHHSERCLGETPLGRAIVLARPPKGYGDLSACLALVEAYVRGWKDTAGAPLPGINETVVKAVVNEFRALAATEPTRHKVTMMLKGPVTPGSVAYSSTLRMGPPFVLDGSLGHQRDRLNLRVYHPRVALLNLNRIPISLLTAFIHGMGDVKIWELNGGNRERIGPSYSLNHPLLLKPFFHNQLSENNYLVTNWGWEPLLSLTESGRLGSQLMTGRPFTSWKGLWNLITGWRQGYDAKDHSQVPLGMVGIRRLTNINHIAGFTDIFRGHERVGLLACLMNPHMNLNSLVLDEALPNPLPNRINGVGISTTDSISLGHTYGRRNFGVRRMFDKKDPHKVSGWACLDSGDLSVESLGRCLSPTGQVLASTRITTNVAIYNVIDIHSQRDWEAVCRDPATSISTLAPGNPASAWVSYPEIPGVPPADWDGHLALKPRFNPTPSLGGGTLLARVPLWPYDLALDPCSETGGLSIWPKGPRVIPLTKHPHKIDFCNSLKPGPGNSRTSLLASSHGDIDNASDLLPGGGLRMSSFGNSASMDQTCMPLVPDGERKQALLTLRNALVPDDLDRDCPDPYQNPIIPSRVLPSPHQGAVSFYFKPAFAPEKMGQESKTLFFMPFVIDDKETRVQADAQGGTYQAESSFRTWYTGHVRLSWGSLPISGHRIFSGRSNNPNFGFGAGTPMGPYPFVQPFGTCTPSLTAPTHYFTGLTGYPLGASPIKMGNLITGGTYMDGTMSGTQLFTGNAWGAPAANNGHWGAANPYPNESVFVEYFLTKYASMDVTVPWPLAPRNPGWDVWDAEDTVSPLGRACAYTNLGTGVPGHVPLNLFDFSSPGLCEYHTIRKVMVLNHPMRADGTGPVDRDGNHQPMIMPGRWNHIFIAWKNMEDLLDNSVSGHRGGCIAVYLNGRSAKVAVTLPASMSMWPLFAQSDVSMGYYSEPAIPAWRAHYAPLVHPDYDDPTIYSDTQKTSLVPWPRACTDVSQWLYTPAFGSLGSTLRTHEMTYAIGKRDYLFPELHRSIPPRFYFGCQPLDLMRGNSSGLKKHPVFCASGIAWGSFMDIQIFNKASPTIENGDGGFKPDLTSTAMLALMAPYPTSATLDIFPLQINTQWPTRLIQLRWTAHLPEFHQFWDETSASLGPDANDASEMNLSAFTHGSLTPSCDLGISQIPSSIPLTSWTPPANLGQMTSVSDLRLDLNFLVQVSGTIAVNTATPIVESIELTLATPLKFTGYSQE